MHLILCLVLSMIGQASKVRVEVRNSEVWLVRDGTEQQLTHDGKSKIEAALSPASDRIAYFEACPEAEHCAPSVVILDLSGQRLASFEPKLQAVPSAEPCASILSLVWVGDHAIGAECHINPSLSEYVETDIATGQTTRDLLGYWFTPSPDGKWIAHVGWIPHFAPPFAQSNYLQIDRTTIYPLPNGKAPVEQEGLPEPPDVVRRRGLTYVGIHEFISEFVWSPDSLRIALVDCTYDWTANRPDASSAADGKESNRHCSLVVAGTTGKVAHLPLTDSPFDQLRKVKLVWQGSSQVTLRAGELKRALTVPW